MPLRPGAHNLRQFWENILARRREFRRIPKQRLSLADYHDPDLAVPDKTHCDRIAVTDGFEFDWVKRRIPKSAVDSTDIVHWLALEIAMAALENASLNPDKLPKERAGVVLGNTLTGEQTRAETLRLRWPFVRRALRTAAEAKVLPPQSIAELTETMEAYYKSVFAPITEDTLAGGLSNTIGGRICNFLDFHGGGYTVDGACSSSLIAVATAATALANGDLDLALAGGVDVSLDTFELVGFAKVGALAKEDMRVYDRRANGFLPGEGCGFVVLKRLEDARRDGDAIYAVVRGWGLSSDGRGGITAPNAHGQALAMRRAHARAGYSPRDLAFVEGHGTGTPVGDVAELEGIALALNEGAEPPARSCGVTSVTSIIGHTKAAAGIAGFIKAVMAVNRRVLPPTANCTEPNPIFNDKARCLYPILQGEIRKPTETLRAGVSAAGFGGINCHVTLESGDPPSTKFAPSIAERTLLVANQETELFALAAPTVPALLDRVRAVQTLADGMSIGELADLAALLARELNPAHPIRVAVIGSKPESLLESLQNLDRMLRDQPPAPGEFASSPRQDIWLGNATHSCRIGFLFPGQGSQQINMARTLVERFDWARQITKQAERSRPSLRSVVFAPLDRVVDSAQLDEWSSALAQTEIAQPAVCLASALWTERLKELGISPVAVGGHSLGELTAFWSAGVFDLDSLFNLAALRGRAMAAPPARAGAMAALACSRKDAEAILKRVDGYAVIANLNSPRQTVLSGERAAVEQAVQFAEARHIKGRLLPVSNAFHSKFVKAAAARLRAGVPVPDAAPATAIRVLSCMDGKPVRPGAKLKDHFARQVLSQVNFVALVKAMARECDLLVEVGPGQVLSGLVSAITDGKAPLCLSVESKPAHDRDLNNLLACVFVRGGKINWPALYENRLVRPFIPASQRKFIENPCEKPFPSSLPAATSAATRAASSAESALAEATKPPALAPPTPAAAPTSIPNLVLELVSKRTGFPPDSLSLEMRLLDDLNLDSIKGAELIAEGAKRLGIAGQLDPTKLGGATLAEVAERLEKVLAESRGPSAEPTIPVSTTQAAPSVWVRDFVLDYVAEPLPARVAASRRDTTPLVILCEPSERAIADALGARLCGSAAHCDVLTFAEASAAACGKTRLPRRHPVRWRRLRCAFARCRHRILLRHRCGGQPASGTA